MSTPPRPASPADIKSCCTAAYGGDAVTLLLGEAYHPGGLALTRRLADAVGLRPEQRVLDIASGPGSTARLLAIEHDVRVDGIDLGHSTVNRAREATAEAGLSHRVRFHLGDAERLPVPAAGYDAVLCECAFCTFPDKPTAAAEFARALRAGGRVGITDVVIAPAGLPDELSGVAGWVACIADARPVEEYTELLKGAGLRVLRTERHDSAIQRMIDQIGARMTLLRITASERLAEAGVDPDAVEPYLQAARAAVAEGTIGYALMVAEKPDTGA